MASLKTKIIKDSELNAKSYESSLMFPFQRVIFERYCQINSSIRAPEIIAPKGLSVKGNTRVYENMIIYQSEYCPTFRGNLTIGSDLIAPNEEIQVHGDLHVGGRINARNLYVEGDMSVGKRMEIFASVFCKKSISAKGDMVVGGNLKADDNIYSNGNICSLTGSIYAGKTITCDNGIHAGVMNKSVLNSETVSALKIEPDRSVVEHGKVIIRDLDEEIKRI